MDPVLMTKPDATDRMAFTPTDRVQLEHEGYQASDSQPEIDVLAAPVEDTPSDEAPAA